MPETNPDSPQLSRDEAQLICDRYEIGWLLNNPEEVERLERYNPDLLLAYEVLAAIANGDDG